MFKNINWNVMIPSVVASIVVGVGLFFLTKPGGWLNKADGDDELED